MGTLHDLPVYESKQISAGTDGHWGKLLCQKTTEKSKSSKFYDMICPAKNSLNECRQSYLQLHFLEDLSQSVQ